VCCVGFFSPVVVATDVGIIFVGSNLRSVGGLQCYSCHLR
jgi:hypothetical protein